MDVPYHCVCIQRMGRYDKAHDGGDRGRKRDKVSRHLHSLRLIMESELSWFFVRAFATFCTASLCSVSLRLTHDMTLSELFAAEGPRAH